MNCLLCYSPCHISPSMKIRLSIFSFGVRMMANDNDHLITKDMVIKYNLLSERKKELEKELDELKKTFHIYFDNLVGKNVKGEITVHNYKLQRQIRNTQKFNEVETVKRLEELNMKDLIRVVKKPDEEKINAAMNLNFLNEDDLKGCVVTSSSQAIVVKPL